VKLTRSRHGVAVGGGGEATVPSLLFGVGTEVVCRWMTNGWLGLKGENTASSPSISVAFKLCIPLGTTFELLHLIFRWYLALHSFRNDF
jgi:hypothetical protein